MLTDKDRERMHFAMCRYACLTDAELALLGGVTIEQERQYKREQKMKILAAANREGLEEWAKYDYMYKVRDKR